MKRFLIAAGAGFIDLAVIRYLIEKTASVLNKTFYGDYQL
jgi:dTDP-D-glucose 4,6-dehydratase